MNIILSTMAKHGVLSLLYRAPDPIEPDGSNVPPDIKNGMVKLASGIYWIGIVVLGTSAAIFFVKSGIPSANRSKNLKSALWALAAAVILGSVSVLTGFLSDIFDFYKS
jgi:hypothetical protein